MRRALIWSVSAIVLTWAASAHADSPRLKGDYAFTGSAACIVAPGSSPTPTNPTPGVALANSGFFTDTVTGPGGHRPFQPKDGHVFSSSHSAEGIRTFNGDGTGTLSGTSVYIVPPPGPGPAGTYPSFGPSAGSTTFSASFTYTVNPDGTFTVKLVPGTFNETFVTGGRAGQTATIDTIPLTGLIGENAKVLTIASVDPSIETTTYSNGDVWPSICHRSRVLIKMEKMDKKDD